MSSERSNGLMRRAREVALLLCALWLVLENTVLLAALPLFHHPIAGLVGAWSATVVHVAALVAVPAAALSGCMLLVGVAIVTWLGGHSAQVGGGA